MRPILLLALTLSLSVFSPIAFSQYTADTLKLALDNISYRDKNAEQALNEIIADLQEQNQKELEVKALLHLMKALYI